jgi:Holliday junction resolvase RusA-like endonuclease
MLPKSCKVVLRFTVAGEAKPAGSKRSFVPLNKHTKQPFRDGHGRVVVSTVDDNPKSKEWKREIAQVARQLWGARPLLDRPLALMCVFYEPRPKSHFGSGRNSGVLKTDAPVYPARRPDVLKLTRAVEDSLTSVVWRDDSLIVHEELRKEWGDHAGVQITVALMPDAAPATELFPEKEAAHASENR